MLIAMEPENEKNINFKYQLMLIAMEPENETNKK